MALTDCGFITLVPFDTWPYVAGPLTTTFNNANAGAGCIWIADDATQITGVHVEAVVTLTCPQLTFELQAVTESGTPPVPTPSGTDIGGTPSPTSVTQQLTTGSNYVAFTNGYTPTAGTEYAVVITVSSGADASNYVVIDRNPNQRLYQGTPFAITSTDAGSTWTVGSASRTPHIAPRKTDGSYPRGFMATSNTANVAWGTDGGDNPLWRGNQFSLPVNFRVIGYNALWRSDAGEDMEFHIYSGTSPYASRLVDTARGWAGEFAGAPGFVPCTPWEGTASTTYHCVFEPQSSAGPTEVCRLEFVSTAAREAYCGAVYGTHSDSGTPSWSPQTTYVYPISPVIDQLDTGTAGGGQGISQGLHTIDGSIVA
jgi:hypothetical protein